MKKILISGANSYVGMHVSDWLLKQGNKYQVVTLDMKNENWSKFDFSIFDVVFHVAGIAHMKETKKNRELYFKVNRDLAIKTAIVAKKSGVKQFIYMSSMSVYNIDIEKITYETNLEPTTYYGMSKMEAEKGIRQLQSESFIITILRPPIIYGYESKGNFQKLVKFAKKVFIFPNIYNQKSMLYIDNLSMIISHIIDDSVGGILFPQNSEYANTTNIVRLISKNINRKIWFTKLLNPLINLFRNKITIINKVFGTQYIDIEISKPLFQPSFIDFETSIICSVTNNER